jgi:hypothetical protein
MRDISWHVAVNHPDGIRTVFVFFLRCVVAELPIAPTTAFSLFFRTAPDTPTVRLV